MPNCCQLNNDSVRGSLPANRCCLAAAGKAGAGKPDAEKADAEKADAEKADAEKAGAEKTDYR